MTKELKRQDRNGTRTSEELRRRYKLNEIEPTVEEVEELKKLIVVDSALSTTSTNSVQNKVITAALNNKVNKEAGKGLSTNDFTNTLYDKLIDIEYNAEKNVITSISVNGKPQTITNTKVDLQIENAKVDENLSTSSVNPVQNKVITNALNNKVDKEAGMGLSENNFTNTLYDKLIDIEYNAEKNVITSISVNGKPQTITDTKVDLQIEDKFTNTYKSQVEANTTARHNHSNKTLLDTYTQTEANLASAVSNKHSHSNKAVLDSITQTQIDKWNTEKFTDDYKQQVEDNTELRHFHVNMPLLQSYEQTEDDLRDAVGKRHTHSNKALLDTYTQTNANIADAVTKKHSHSNKALLDTYTQTEANLAAAVSNKHTHSNKSVLDGITSTLVSNWNNAASNAHSASVSSSTNTNTIRLGKALIQSGRTSAKVTTGGTPIQLSFNFPVAFKNAPTLIVQPSTSAPNSIWVTSADSTTTQGKYWFYRPNTSATIIEWLAIGEGV
jgi:hypothetical protein